ncbi:MAG TPA: PPOX class F420-dependent oxidoreductase [bacterium]|nr:PPOX class F420-dependent oxidoreductase [bacterium]
MPVRLDERTRAFLSEPNVAMLATVSPRGRVQATPIWFLLDGDQIVVNTSRGRLKLKNLEAHPYLALTVVDPKNMYRYVQIQGKVARFDPQSGARDIDRLSQRYRGQSYSYGYGGRPEDRVTIVIDPLSVSGMGRR